MISLSLDYNQSNDAKKIILTDATGDYSVSNVGGWGSPNIATSDITTVPDTASGKYHLTIQVTITLSTEEEIICDTVDLRSSFASEFSKTSGMIYELTTDILLYGGNTIATDVGTFPDGVYKVTYKLSDANSGIVQNSIEYNYLVDGNVRKKIYEDLANVPEVYNCKTYNANDQEYRDIIKNLFNYTYFQGMLSNPTISEKEDKIDILNTLERLLNE